MQIPLQFPRSLRGVVAPPIAACLLVIALASGPTAQTAGAAAPRPVGTVALTRQAVPFSVTTPGRAVAFRQVGIRPQVGGAVTEIAYKPGDRVEQGTLLFRIDDRPYRAAVASAEAGVARAQAALVLAQTTLERNRKLSGVGVAAEEVQTAEATVAQSKADVAVAQAALETARLDLEHTEIHSPFAGVVDVAAVSVGDLVTASQATALTTVTQLDPIYVDVAESSVRMLNIRDRFEAGTLQRGDKAELRLDLDNGQSYGGDGVFVSPGVSVSTATGTTTLRMQFANPERKVLPGQFLRVTVTLGTSPAVLVPQGATSRAADGTLTAFVVRGGKAVQVTLTEAGSYQNAWVVTAGVDEGEALIVDGLKNLRNGAVVAPVPVTISPEGVVEDAPETDSKSGN